MFPFCWRSGRRRHLRLLFPTTIYFSPAVGKSRPATTTNGKRRLRRSAAKARVLKKLLRRHFHPPGKEVEKTDDVVECYCFFLVSGVELDDDGYIFLKTMQHVDNDACLSASRTLTSVCEEMMRFKITGTTMTDTTTAYVFDRRRKKPSTYVV